MSKPEYIASDVHLGGVPKETERTFVQFLEHVGESASRLLLAGDLFDFWFEYGSVIDGRHFRVLAALSKLVEGGIPVTLAGGNHDAWGGRFLREEVGIEFHDHPFHTEIAGLRALVAHGDGLGKGDLRYRMLKLALRSRVAVAGFRIIHPELGLRIAHAVSSTEGKAVSDDAVQGRARFIQDWSTGQLREDPTLCWVVCGHSHLPTILEVEPGRHYINAGDWINHHSYITVGVDAKPILRRWGNQAALP
jgi:UDP-2,3-diacylglucosamine hydrolase